MHEAYRVEARDGSLEKGHVVMLPWRVATKLQMSPERFESRARAYHGGRVAEETGDRRRRATRAVCGPTGDGWPVSRSEWLSDLRRGQEYDEGAMQNEYAAVIKRDGQWWIGWIEEIPGVNCQGATRDELVANLQSALREMLDINREQARKAAHDGFEEIRISA